MDSEIVRGIGLIVVLGVGLQWAARMLRVPSIVLLLAGGLAVGPGLGAVDPDEIFGDALFPVVSLAVGVLLFNGGLELRIADLRGGARRPVLRLVTLGTLVTWALTSLTVHLVFHEPVRVSVLLGALLVVTGPTVVGPLLRLARLACMAPRGVVAASTAALYALRLEDIGQASEVPVTFAVIIALAVVYGVGSVPAARRLGVERRRPQGALLVSGRPWALGLATELSRNGVTTVVVARGRADLVDRDDLPFGVYTGLIHALGGSGLLADVRAAIVASRDDETDLMALGVLVEALGRRNVWLLPSESVGDAIGEGGQAPGVDVWARRPFGPGVTHEVLERAVAPGHRVVTVDADDVPPDALVLARVGGDGSWTVAAGAPLGLSEKVIVIDGVVRPAAVPHDRGDADLAPDRAPADG